MRRDLEEALASAILALPGVEERPSQFNKKRTAFWIGSREFAHVETGVLDLRLTLAEIRARREGLRAADARVHLRGGDWVEVVIRSEDDVGYAVELVRAAIEANRP